MFVCIGQQCQKSSTLYSCRQLLLIMAFCSGNSAWNNFSSFSDVFFQSINVFVVNLINSFGSKSAILIGISLNNSFSFEFFFDF